MERAAAVDKAVTVGTTAGLDAELLLMQHRR